MTAPAAPLVHMEEMLDAVLIFIRRAASLEPGGPAVVDVDITAVQRVVTNLVENALKYGGQARVRLWADEEEAVVEVRDAGPGLPPEEIEQVFQPSYRSETGRLASTKGIGLGPAMSRSIARAHGGDVTVRNAHAGLIAELRLPLARTHSGAAATAEFASAA